MKKQYLVSVFWKQRPLTRHCVLAENESQAVAGAVSRCCKFENEPYDNKKTKAMVI